jgi:hypothetical protein
MLIESLEQACGNKQAPKRPAERRHAHHAWPLRPKERRKRVPPREIHGQLGPSKSFYLIENVRDLVNISPVLTVFAVL